MIDTNNKRKIFIGNDSGFISYKSDNISICLNYIGHQELKKSIIDPRLIGCIPIWISYKHKPIIPAPPYTHGFNHSGPNVIPLSENFFSIYDFNYKWFKNLAYSSGFLSYLTQKKNILILQGADKIDYKIEDDKLILQFKCPIWKINMNRYLIFLKSSIAYLRKRLNKSYAFGLISKINYYALRSIIIDNETIYIKDKYSKLGENFNFVPFTIRTFDDATIKSYNNYFIISNTNGTNIFINKSENEHIKLKKQLCSSTGKIKLWQINNDQSQLEENYEFDRMLLITDNKKILPDNKIKNNISKYSKILDNSFKEWIYGEQN